MQLVDICVQAGMEDGTRTPALLNQGAALHLRPPLPGPARRVQAEELTSRVSVGLYLGTMVDSNLWILDSICNRGQYLQLSTVFAIVDSIWTIHPLMRDKSARPPPRRARQRFLHKAVSGETAAQGSEAAKGDGRLVVALRAGLTGLLMRTGLVAGHDA